MNTACTVMHACIAIAIRVSSHSWPTCSGPIECPVTPPTIGPDICFGQVSGQGGIMHGQCQEELAIDKGS